MDSLEMFARDLEEILTTGMSDMIQQAAHRLEAWIQSGVHLPPSVLQAAPDAMVQYLLKPGPRDLYTIVTMVMWPGYRTPIHNHGTWGLVGLFQGVEKEERFDVHPSLQGTTTLHLRRETLNQPGSVTVLTSPDDEVHRITNMSDAPSLSIHVYGGNIDGKERLAYAQDAVPDAFVTRLKRSPDITA